MVVVSLQEVFPICWILILTFSHIYFVIHGSGRAGSGRVCAWGRANMFRALRRTCFMLSSLLIETRSDSSRRGTGFCMNHENHSLIFSRIIQPFWRLQEYCSWFMLIFVSNLLYTILEHYYLSCGSESYHAVLTTQPGNEKIHSCTTRQPRREDLTNY